MVPHVFHFLGGQGGQDSLAHTGAVQRAAQAHPAGHPHRTAFRFINVHNVPCIADDQMHGLAGALAQPLQMRLGHVHDLHAVDDTAGQLKHF